MKKSKKRKLFIIFFALATTISLSLAFAATWTPSAYVSRVYGGYNTGDVYIKGLSNVAGCSSSTIKFTNSNGEPSRVEVLGRTAIVAHKKIKCAVNGCNGSYQRGYQCYITQ